MRLNNVRSLCLGCALAGVAAVPARADFCFFKDDNPTRITVVSNGFYGAPLTLDGHIVIKHLDRNVYKKMPKSETITFTGTDDTFSNPQNFSADYIFVSKKDKRVPVAELSLSGAVANNGEAFKGTFRGFGDPTLPVKIPKHATLYVLGRHGVGIVIGGPPGSVAFGVQIQYTR